MLARLGASGITAPPPKLLAAPLSQHKVSSRTCPDLQLPVARVPKMPQLRLQCRSDLPFLRADRERVAVKLGAWRHSD